MYSKNVGAIGHNMAKKGELPSVG